jgi:hypothetical protein
MPWVRSGGSPRRRYREASETLATQDGGFSRLQSVTKFFSQAGNRAMAEKQQRLELRIDLLDRTNQRAQALPSLTATELITAILEEFDEVDYLGNSSDDYVLYRKEDNALLDASIPLNQQLAPNAHLLLKDKEVSLPSGGRRCTQAAYLREMKTGTVYKLNWLPAFIGRPDKSQPHNSLLCVNLEAHPSGVRVSRRHACITGEKGTFYIEGLSNNPTLLRRDTVTTKVTTEKQALQDGDQIVLGRSDITLKFILRNEQSN